MKTKTNLMKRGGLLLLCLIAFIKSWGYSSNYGVMYDFASDGIFYRYNADRSSVSVTYSIDYYNQRMFNITASYTGDVVIPESVTNNDISYPVTGIDWYAFNNSKGLTSVTIPNTVTTIGERAFAYCTSLKEINLPTSITQIGIESFYESGLETFTVPQTITSIVRSMFDKCKSLQTINFHEGVKEIEYRAFADCTSLNNVMFPDGVTTIDPEAFYGCTRLENVRLPNRLTYIGWSAFSHCSALKEITIPESVERIDDYAFSSTGLTTLHLQCNLADYDSETLELLNIGKGVFQSASTNGLELKVYLSDYYTGIALCLNQCFNTSYPSSYGWRPYRFFVNDEEVTHYTIAIPYNSIPAYFFNGLLSVKTVELPPVQSIGERAFSYCTNLESISFPNSLTSIDRYAFQGCTSLEEITFGTGIQSIAVGAFESCTNISKVDIGDVANWCSVDFDPTNSMANQYESAWNKNYANPLMYAKKIYLSGSEVNTLRIPSGVTRIGNWAFLGCARFDKLTIPSSVQSIGMYAFCGCVDLADISFAKKGNIEAIEAGAFYGCTGLTDISLPTTLKTLGRRSFYQCSNLVSITIPVQVEEIESSTFYECSKLQNVSLPEGLTSIGSWAFSNCSALEKIEIPSSLKYIGANGFYNCRALKGVYITDLAAWCRISMPGQELGGGYAGEYHDNNPLIYAHNLYLNNELVTDLVIPQGVETVGALTFIKATCLKSVTIPEGCKTLGGGAFYGCNNIETIHIPASMENFETVSYTDAVLMNVSPFHGAPSTDVNLYIEDLEKWITNLGDKYWYYRSDMKYLVNLYVNGELVTDLIVPETITKMGATFQGFGFTSATLPSGLETVSENVLRFCAKIENIYSRSRFAPTGTTGLTVSSALKAIYVPKGRSSNYKTSWTKNTSIIFEAPEEVRPTGTLSVSSLRTDIDAHQYVYDDIVPYIDLTETTIGAEVMQKDLQEIADQGTVIFLPDGNERLVGPNIVSDGQTPKLILRDSTDFASPYDFVADELVYLRRFMASKKEATTMCLPYSITELPQGMKAYALTKQDDEGNAVFTEVEAMEANKPYLVTTSKSFESLSGTNVLVKETPMLMPDNGCDAFEFRGTLSTITHDDAADEEAYVLSTNRQWQSVYDAEESVYVPAGRAYLIPTDIAGISFGTILNTTADYAAGDANGDGRVSVADITAIINHLKGVSPDGFVEVSADVNGDGRISIADVTEIINIINK